MLLAGVKSLFCVESCLLLQESSSSITCDRRCGGTYFIGASASIALPVKRNNYNEVIVANAAAISEVFLIGSNKSSKF